MLLRNRYFPIIYRNMRYLVLFCWPICRCAHIKSLVSFAPSCNKYQSPLDELARIPFFRVIQMIESMCGRKKKNAPRFDRVLQPRWIILPRIARFARVPYAISHHSRFVQSDGILISDRPENIVVSKTHYDSGHFIIRRASFSHLRLLTEFDLLYFFLEKLFR